MKKFEELVGLGLAKTTLKETVVDRLYSHKTLGPAESMLLLFGPPGTGKTSLVLACATASKAALLYVNCTIFPAKDGVKGYFKTLFDKARNVAPSIVFIDDIDWLCNSDRAAKAPQVGELRASFLEDTAAFLAAPAQVCVIAATSRPWDVDEPVLSRFPRKVFVPPPGPEERAEMFRPLGAQCTGLTEADYKEFAERTEGLTGSRITILVKDCLFEPLRKCQGATRFRVCPDGYYEPAKVDDPASFPATLANLKDPSKLRAPPLAKVDCGVIAFA